MNPSKSIILIPGQRTCTLKNNFSVLISFQMIGSSLVRPIFTRPRGVVRQVSLCVQMKQKGGKGKPSHTFNSDQSRVLDRGVWKKYKYCSHCELIMVERAKWSNNFEAVKFCSDKCRREAKSQKLKDQE